MKLFYHRVFVEDNYRKKALFIISLLIGCSISIIHSVNQFLVYRDEYIKIISNADSYTINPCLPVYTVYNFWIGCDSNSHFSKLYFNVMPFISMTPHMVSVIFPNRQYKNVFSNQSQLRYLNKLVDSMLFSGLIVIIPLILNFSVLLLFFPLTAPDSIYNIYYGVFSRDFLSYLYYNFPFFYVLIYLLIDFIFCGLFGCLVQSFALQGKYRIPGSIMPFGIILFLEAINNKYHSHFLVEISPLSIMFPVTSHNSTFIVIFTEIAILILFSFIIPMTRSNENET